MSDSVFAPVVRGNNIHLNLEFEGEAEAYAAFNNLSEGGKVHQPLNPAFWGSLFGEVEDKFGVLWMITTAAKGSPV